MIPLHLALCLVAAVLAWPLARPVALTLLAVAAATIAGELTHAWPASLAFQLVGPVAVATAAQHVYARRLGLAGSLPALLGAWPVLAPSRLTIALGLTMAHLAALLIGILAAIDRPRRELTTEDMLTAVLVASSGGGAVGAVCWHVWGTRDLAAWSDIAFLALLILGGIHGATARREA